MAWVLLVEDDDHLRRCLKTVLEKELCQVEEAPTLDEAVRQTSKRDFDLIITDYQLGRSGNGLSLMKHLMDRGSRVPVIVMSGMRTRWLEPAARNLGACAFLEKPFAIDFFKIKFLQALQGAGEPRGFPGACTMAQS
jgi:DNA-binding NtrC family response regulator